MKNMTQEGMGLGEIVEELKQLVEHMRLRLNKLETDSKMFKKELASKNKNFENAMEYIKSKKFIPFSELRDKFTFLTNHTTIEKFNQIYSNDIAIFRMDSRGHPHFYAHCPDTEHDFLHDFSRLWNGTMGAGENFITIDRIKKECDFKSDKEMESVKNFVEKFLNEFAFLDGYNLKRKVL
jgi:hypothetical protein